MGKILRLLLTIFFLAIFVWVSGMLFFRERIESIQNWVVEKYFAEEEVEIVLDTLRVVFPTGIEGFDPALLDPHSRQRLVNIYEPLVKTDRDLNVKPALAVSWGLLDDLTWEFQLRPGVKFHDGSSFEAEDVITSIEYVQNNDISGSSEFFDSIADVEVINDYKIHIKTVTPDPLLLQKMATVLIFPSEKVNDLSAPIGTGPYQLATWEPNVETKFIANNEYWGGVPRYQEVQVFPVSDVSERVGKLFNGEADLLAFVPYSAVEVVQSSGYEIRTIPSLEVQFLIFNFDSDFFAERDLRQMFSLMIDQNALVERVGGFARGISQFVSSGVFGYSPSIQSHQYDETLAEEIFAANFEDSPTVQFHLPVGLDVLGNYVREQMAKIGVSVVVSYLDIQSLMESMSDGDADLYFLAFQASVGDSSSFLDTIVHSEGEFNIADYQNEAVDLLIENSFNELNDQKRLSQLQEAMEVVVRDDLIGVPLFEYETVYAFDEKIDLVPRIDGLIYFDDVIPKATNANTN